MRKSMRRALTFVAAILCISLPATLALAGSASAGTVTSSDGTVSLSTTGAVAPGGYSSGQTINISAAANATMSSANLATFGFPGGAVAIKALECADPGGLPANLPTTISQCQPDTIASIASANSDGSMNFFNYPVYALPDSILFGESSAATPVCGTTPNLCVVGLFSNYNNFADPHIFSAPFQVIANSDDGGGNPGDGGSQVIFFNSTPANPYVNFTYTPSVSGGPSGNPVVVSIDSTSSGCSISGPTVTFTAVGTCVLDANQAGNGTYAAAAPVSQSINPTMLSGFYIATTSLPGATRGASYSAQLQAFGGATPYKWKKIGSLPKGLKLNKNGLLSGTPKTKHVNPGNYTFTAQATTKKSKGHPAIIATRSLTLTLS